MTHRIGWFALAAVLAVALPAQAQEKYTIKLKKSAQGDTDYVEKTVTDATTTKIFDKDGKELKNDSPPKKESKYVFRETILEKKPGARLASKVERTYEVATVTTAGKTVPLPYQGKTVLIEKKDGTYHFTLKGGGELDAKDAATLRSEFNPEKETETDMEKLLLPTRPIAAGETWEMDREAIAKEFKSGGQKKGMDIDAAGVKGTGKLLKVYRKDGRQFGVMHVELTIPVTRAKGLDIEKATVSATGDMDVCIDGTADLGTVTGQFGIQMLGKISGQEIRVEFNSLTNSVEVHKAAPPR